MIKKFPLRLHSALTLAGLVVALYMIFFYRLLGIPDRIYTVFEGQITDNIPASEATPEALMRSMTSAKKKANA